MAQTIVVTGATGQVGGKLAAQLRERGVSVRAIGRSADRLKDLVQKGAEARVGSLDDASFLEAAFSGADGVFAMIPPNYQAPDQRAHQRRMGDVVAAAIEKAGVRRAVSLSSVGAERTEGTGPIVGLRDFEERLDRLPRTSVLHLRPGYFMENHLHSIGVIKNAGISGSPVQPDAAFSMVATRDIAAVAAESLLADSIAERGFREVLGPRGYTMREATAILGKSIGRPDLPYVVFTAEDTRKALLGMGFSADAAEKFLELYDGLSKGRVKPVQGWNPSTTTSTTLEQFALSVFAPAFGA
jgi:uncharacterized protein YbjT (DUF2867 family)